MFLSKDPMVSGLPFAFLFVKQALIRAAKLVANFTTASIGIIDTIARVGPKNCLVLSLDILATGCLPDPKLQVPIDLATDLVSGSIAVSNVATILTLPAADLASPPSPTPPSSPVVQALAQETISVAQSVWRCALAPWVPRHSSRLATVEMEHFVSIVDKAIMRKKGINEGTSQPPRRYGELVADDLQAVVVEEDHPLLLGDAAALAGACDIPVADLTLETSPSTASSPC
jgi:hypothetical protein